RHQIYQRRSEIVPRHLARDLFEQPDIRDHDFRRQRLPRPGQISERWDHAVSAGPDRQLLVRIGNSKFVLSGTGKAVIYNAVTNPTTGDTSLVQGNATLDS